MHSLILVLHPALVFATKVVFAIFKLVRHMLHVRQFVLSFADLLLTRRYMASDDRCYGLDVTADRAVGQTFSSNRDTQRTDGTSARLTTLAFLLNSKAYAYMTRAGPDSLQKRADNAADFFFVVEYMRKHRIGVNRKTCRWVVDYDFWTTFCNDFEGAERALRAPGLQRDPTPSSSNRETRNSSSTRRSGTSSESRSGGPRRG